MKRALGRLQRRPWKEVVVNLDRGVLHSCLTAHRSLHFVRDKVHVKDKVNSAVSVPVFSDGAGAHWDLKLVWCELARRSFPLPSRVCPAASCLGLEHAGLLATG